MSKKANPTIIGAFAVGAIVFAVIAATIFGAGKFFTTRPRAVVFFQTDIQGLNVGAPVNLRGVQVGSVTEIRISVDMASMQPTIAVYLEFEPDRLTTKSGAFVDSRDQRPLKTAIANGLHARLASQSLVTGQLLIELDLNPDEPRTLVGADPSTVEIPSSLSEIAKLKNLLTQVPVDSLAEAALRLLQDADKLITSPQLPALLQSITTLGTSATGLADSARGNLTPLTAELRDAVHSSQEAIAEMHRTLANFNQLMKTDGRAAVKATTTALNTANKVMTAADSVVAANSAQRYDLDQTLRNLTATTRSLRLLADELQRRPNAVIMGR